MIEITTLFLSLVFGPQLVEIDVSPDVAAVEIVLDDNTVARLDGPPWEARVDLGPGLLAHRLEAVAFDDGGHEIDRAVRFVNLGHQRQGGRLVLLEGADGRPEAVQLGWESIGQREPVDVELFFDDEPVEIEDPQRIPLPDYEIGDFHFVSAVFHFHDGGTRRMEAGFGGRLGLEVSSALTAVSVQPTSGTRPPGLDRLEKAFRARGGSEPLPVHGLEKGSAEIILIRDDDVQPILEDLVQRVAGASPSGMLERGFQRRSRARAGSGLPLQSGALQGFAKLPPSTRFRVLAPKAALLQPLGVSPDMFLVSDPIDAHARGLLTVTLEDPPQTRDTQLGSAVALAGMMAHGTQRPRAVVLILGEGGRDVSSISSAAARGYLRDLGVPLQVWAFDPLPQNTGWGPIHSLGSKDDLGEVKSRFSKLTHQLAGDLRRQRLVWLRGRYLPREIDIAQDVEGIEFAGRSQPPEPSQEDRSPP